MAKWVYMFTEGNADMRNLLGGKGANLAEMTNLGLPVPQGFTVTTEACTQYYEDGRQINDEIMGQIMEAIDKMEGSQERNSETLRIPLLDFCTFRSKSFHARYDGYHPEPWSERRGC